ncbi:MAG: phosphodiester glycosidase family protein, partial [Kovacikia sp.]
VIRDSLGSRQANARSAVGMTSDGNLVWVMVAQRTEAPTSSGMSLEELANFMKTLGVEQAINLDGGSSSSLYYQGKTVYGKVNEAGDRIQRSIKSVLLVVGDHKAEGKE